MDINRFVSRRKELGFSQVQLAQGICTQATLSKFENNGQIPSLNILQQLCNRLGLSLDELSQNDKNSIVYLNRQLKQAEIDLMIGNFLAAQECLSNISINSQSTLIHQMQFYLIRGLLELLLDQDHEGAIADFKLVTEELDQEQSTIWYYLGQAGLALVYDREQYSIAAKEHFKLVATYVDQLINTTVEKITDFEYVLAISYIIGRYYWQNNFLQAAENYINFGLQLAQYHHVTYFVPRLYMVQTEILKAQGADASTIEAMIHQAAVFAEFNHNQVVQKWVQEQGKGELYDAN